ncbi:MAG: hypothetical protein WC599_00715 [Bacteroidales bacterium]
MNEATISNCDWLSAVITVFIFFLGFYFNILNERYKANKFLRDKELFFWELMSALLTQIKTQITQNSDCINRLKDPHELDTTLGKSSGQHIESIKKLDENDLYKILIQRKRGGRKGKPKRIANFHDLLVNLDYFTEAIPNLLESNQKTIELINNYRIDWNESHKKTMAIYNEYNHLNLVNNISNDADEFLNKLNAIWKNFTDHHLNEKFLIKNGLDHVVQPFIDTCKKYSADERSLYLLSITQLSKEAYNEIEAAKANFSSVLNQTNQDFLRILSNLEQTTNYLKSLKTKSLLMP